MIFNFLIESNELNGIVLLILIRDNCFLQLSLKFLDHTQTISILGTALEGPMFYARNCCFPRWIEYPSTDPSFHDNKNKTVIRTNLVLDGNAAAVRSSSVFTLLLCKHSTLFPQSNPTASPVVPTQTQTATAERANTSTLLKNHLPFPNSCI